MDINIPKEEFSYAYIHAIASSAGYSFQLAPRPLDIDGVDAIIAASASLGSMRRPRLEVQVKCTSRDILDNEGIKYPVRTKNYDDLRYDDRSARNLETTRQVLSDRTFSSLLLKFMRVSG